MPFTASASQKTRIKQKRPQIEFFNYKLDLSCKVIFIFYDTNSQNDYRSSSAELSFNKNLRAFGTFAFAVDYKNIIHKLLTSQFSKLETKISSLSVKMFFFVFQS